MTGTFRSLPDRPSLRYLKLEARRRVSSGEFRALHEAQRAIAREHGLPGWVALKQRIADRTPPRSQALQHLRWVIGRFAHADAPGWMPPGDMELAAHFDDRLLSRLPPSQLIATVTGMAADLRRPLVVTGETPLAVQVRLGGFEILATAAPEPPHRLLGVRRDPVGSRITDARVAGPTTRVLGVVPGAARHIAAEAFSELGLVGLLLAGGSPDTPPWSCARGWADLEWAQPLAPDRPVPAFGITQAVTATALLRLIAAGHVGLDAPANAFLRSVRLVDGGVTVRELLTHTGGVNHPVELLADRVPALIDLLGPVIACTGRRGTVHYSNEGFGVLGQLIADVTGTPYAAAIGQLVLEPLGMSDASFPDRWPAGTMTAYRATPEGMFVAELPRVCTLPAAGGLWASATDLVRFGFGWSTLLPTDLAREALRPQAPAGERSSGERGLGWLIDPRADVIGSSGAGPGVATSLLIDRASGQAFVAVTNRQLRIAPVNARVLDACARR